MLFISYIKIDVKILSNRLYQVHLTMVVNQTRNRCGDTMKIKLTNRNKNAVQMFTLHHESFQKKRNRQHSLQEAHASF